MAGHIKVEDKNDIQRNSQIQSWMMHSANNFHNTFKRSFRELEKKLLSYGQTNGK